jgi:hypothetical protein
VAVKIAVLADLHYRPGGIGPHNRNTAHPEERGDMGHVLWLRAIYRLNRLIRPDVVCVLGDLLDDGTGPDALEALQQLRGLFAHLKAPWIALPGNHDPAPEVFWSVFDRPADWMDFGGVRFLAFDDREEPGFCASRPEAYLERMAYARAGWRGAIVSLQHVPLFPEGACDSPFHYTNADTVIASMRRNGIELALSAHHHPGIDPIYTNDGLCFAAAPALCRAPFEMLVVELDPSRPAGEPVRIERHALAMDPRLRLTDRHIHTQLAYCAENVEARLNLDVGRAFGLAGIGLSEHADHLYMNRLGYFSFEGIRGGAIWSRSPWTPDSCLAPPQTRISTSRAPVQSPRHRPGRNRARGFRPLSRPPDRTVPLACPGGRIRPRAGGDRGQLRLQRPAMLAARDREHFSYVIGAVHQISELWRSPRDPKRIQDDFLATLERFLQYDFQILAHPFRIFHRAESKYPKPCNKSRSV